MLPKKNMAKSFSSKSNQRLSPENYIRQKARNLPINKCLINSNWKTEGLAQIIVSRRHSNGNITNGIYMVDLLCLGLRDSFCNFNMPESELQELIGNITGDFEMLEVDYTLVHNIIFSAIAYADDLGFKPHKEFNTLSKYILEEDDEDIELIEIECGLDGKPAFIRTDSFSDAQAASIINQLKKTVGEGNYTIIVEGSVYEEDDDEVEEDEFDDETWAETVSPRLLEIDELTPEERKTAFLKLSSRDIGELEDDEYEEINFLCDSIYLNDLTEEEAVEQYFTQWKSEYATEISDDEPTGKKDNRNKALSEMKELNDKFIRNERIEIPVFEQLFRNRSTITSEEMTEFQIIKILALALYSDDHFNQLEAQSMIVELLELPENERSTIQGALNLTRINILARYWQNETGEG